MGGCCSQSSPPALESRRTRSVSLDYSSGPSKKRVGVDLTCDVVDLSIAGHLWAGSQRSRARTSTADVSDSESSQAEANEMVRQRSYGSDASEADASEQVMALFASERFVGPRDAVGMMASEVVRDVMLLVDTVDAEELDISDHDWRGPESCNGDVLSCIVRRQTVQERGFGGVRDFIIELCEAAVRILKEQPTLVELRAPVKIFGDIHGQLRDLLLFFNEFGRPSVGRGGDIEVVSYIFNGDWVDRGVHQIEVMVTLLALKVTYPERIWLIRGNHEDEITNKDMGRVGFKAACDAKFGEDGGRIFKFFQKVFNWLPLAASVEERVLVLHGGIGNGQWDLSYLQKLSRPIHPEKLGLDQIVFNILWSDPVPENQDGQDPDGPNNTTFGVHDSDRGSMMIKAFGRDITADFCQRNGLEMIIRSHQCTTHGYGYTLMHGGQLMRVFSARNYDNKKGNAAAMLLLGYKRPRAQGDRGLVVRAKVIRPPITDGDTEQYGEASVDLVRAASFTNFDRKISPGSVASRSSSASSLSSSENPGVEVDEECDVINKSKGLGHQYGHMKQIWLAKDGPQQLNRAAVVGQPNLCGDRFVGPRNIAGQMAGALVARAMELVNMTAAEETDIHDKFWTGPPGCNGNILVWLCEPVLDRYVDLAEGLIELCEVARKVMRKQPELVDLRAPVKIFGELRGQLRDLLLFFDQFGRPTIGHGGDIETTSYVFNGGWIGEGKHQLEMAIILLSLKVTYPQRFWILRGAPEALQKQSIDSFYVACARSFPKAKVMDVYKRFRGAFDCAPFSAIIEKRAFVVHGGIGDGDWDLADLRQANLDEVTEPLTRRALLLDELRRSLLCSQPDVSTTLRTLPAGNDELAMDTFNKAVTKSFCKRNMLGLVVCSCPGSADEGYQLAHSGRLMTVCTARSSTEETVGNSGAMLLIGYKKPRAKADRGLVVRAKVIKPPPEVPRRTRLVAMVTRKPSQPRVPLQHRPESHGCFVWLQNRGLMDWPGSQCFGRRDTSPRRRLVVTRDDFERSRS